jgi:hypothetical protein
MFHELECRGKRLIRRRYLAAVALATVLCLSGTLIAQEQKPTEYDVKAAYLFNFGKFVKWPAREMSLARSFNICVLGRDPFGSKLDELVSGEVLEGKRLSVFRVSSATEASACPIIFISRSEGSRLPAILTALRRHPVLTVSDISGFSNKGGMIEFLMQGEKVRFQVNLPAAQRSGLVFSSELLKVAVAVKRGEGK